MMNSLYSSWNNALDYSRYPRGNPHGNTAPTVLPQMHYRYRGSTVQSVPSPRYYREILPIPTVITAVTAFPITVSFSTVKREKDVRQQRMSDLTRPEAQDRQQPATSWLPACWQDHASRQTDRVSSSLHRGQ